MNRFVSRTTGAFKGNVNGMLRFMMMPLHSFWRVIVCVYVCCAFLMLSATNSETTGKLSVNMQLYVSEF